MTTTSRLLLATAMVLFVNQAHAACFDFAENFGKIKRFYSQYGGATGPATLFQLKNGQTGALTDPTTSYYVVPAQTPAGRLEVYRTLTDLLIEAAKANWTVRVRTLDCGTLPSVAYIFVDY